MGATTEYAELEIGLHRQQVDDAYRAELRFTDPDPKNASEVSPGAGTFVLDRACLLAHDLDPAGYGQALTEQLFADAALSEAYAQARAVVDARDLELRVRLLIGPGVQNLQALRWELLAEPTTGLPFATSERTLFSRFMLSSDWRPIRLRPKADLKALVAVAAPEDWAEWNVAEVLREAEIERAMAALDGIEVDVLDAPLTLGSLLARLREQDVDILYLVCHGLIEKGDRQPYLLLQEEKGTGVWTLGEELARGVAELRQAPRLAVLVSCQSADTEDGFDASYGATVQSSLAPRLAEAGVPAIVAMQGKVKMKTVAKALPVFFRELVKDGQIDRAMAVARGAVRDHDDHWMPVLYLRLKRGRIWYEPGFTGVRDEFEKWKSICSHVRWGKFIPILGPELGERVCGNSRDLAERLADAHQFPMAPHERRDLAKVSQYLATNQDRKYAQAQVLEQLRRQIVERNRELLGADAEMIPFPELLDKLVEERFQYEDDPYRILAELDASVYVNASAEALLSKSLKKAGKKPRVMRCEWRATPPLEPPFTGELDKDRPIVHHVFGVFPVWDSLVLTEDEFFDYLIKSSEYSMLSTVTKGALTESSLLFLGFHLTDWRFRVLLRQIMMLEGSAGLTEYSHVGVQVDPEEHSVLDAERACRYLEQYFIKEAGGSKPPIDIYWGSAADFLRELRRRLAESAGEMELVAAPATPTEDWF